MPSSTLINIKDSFLLLKEYIIFYVFFPLWSLHPAKKTLCQNPSPFKEKAPSIGEKSLEALEARQHMQLY